MDMKEYYKYMDLLTTAPFQETPPRGTRPDDTPQSKEGPGLGGPDTRPRPETSTRATVQDLRGFRLASFHPLALGTAPQSSPEDSTLSSGRSTLIHSTPVSTVVM